MADAVPDRPSRERVSQLLAGWPDQDPAARDALVALVYDELHRLAHHYMRTERPGHTLQTTALVNEAYLRLVGTDPEQPWNGRGLRLPMSSAEPMLAPPAAIVSS